MKIKDIFRRASIVTALVLMLNYALSANILQTVAGWAISMLVMAGFIFVEWKTP